jgi:hypothetical protein
MGDEFRTRAGHQISFSRKQIEKEIAEMLGEVIE